MWSIPRLPRLAALAIVTAPLAVAQVSLGDAQGSISSQITCGGIDTPLCRDFQFAIGAGPHTTDCDLPGGEFCGDGELGDARATLTVQLDQPFSTAAGQLTRVVASGSVDAGHPGVGAVSTASVGYAVSIPFVLTEPMVFSVSGGGTLHDANDNLGTSGELAPGSYTFEVNISRAVRSDQSPSSFAFDELCALRLGQGGEFRWSNPHGGVFADPTNWDSDLVPSADSTAIFGPVIDDDGNEVLIYAVSCNGATVKRFVVEEAFVDLDGTALLSETSSVEPSLTIIRGGKLNLDNAARLSGVNASVGFNPNVPGTRAGMLISGAGSDCTLSGRLIVGEFSDGDLLIDTGGKLSCVQAIVGDIARGEATVTGPDARWNATSLTVGAVSADGLVEVKSGGNLTVSGRMIVGELSPATLAIVDGGSAVAGEAVIGANNISGLGTIELNGDSGVEASSLEVAGPLRVGGAGNGLLEIRDGSSVNANELHLAPTDLGTSHVVVEGTSSAGGPSNLTVFTAASLSNGQLEILDGAVSDFLTLTLGSEGQTEVRVAGFAAPGGIQDTNFPATLNASRLNVGFTDSGLLTVEAGGQVTCTELLVGSGETAGAGTVIANEGKINVNGPLRASGKFQAGDFNVVIEGGGLLTATSLRLGDEATSDAAEIVIRGGSAAASSQMTIRNGASGGECAIGLDGPGVLRLESGALGIVTGLAKVGGSASGGAGLLEIGLDSVFFVGGDLDVGGASPGTITLLTSSSNLSVAGSVEVNNGGRIEGIGTLSITGARIVNPGGFISPGLSPGTLTIDGDYEQGEGGTLIIEVAGLEPGQFDVLKITGNATLAGAVDLRFIDGFVPAPGDSVDFVQVDGTITGKLSGSALVTTDDGTAQAEITWEVTDAGTCRLNVTDVTALDADGNPLMLPADCGAGLCGAGVVPMLPLTCVGLAALRACLQRRRAIVPRHA